MSLSQRLLLEYLISPVCIEIGRWKYGLSIDIVVDLDKQQLRLAVNYALCSRLSVNHICMVATLGSE